MTRRTREQIATDRSTLLESITPLWARLPEANTSDLQALVRQGLIERDVRREWDRQSGNGSMFGGAGVVQRHRAYYRLAGCTPEQVHEAEEAAADALVAAHHADVAAAEERRAAYEADWAARAAEREAEVQRTAAALLAARTEVC